ncbi:hypothetical protein SprV_0200643500 [Sparganum proliferum]
MSRILYIFVVIHILRGCPKTIPLVDHNRSYAPAWTLNFTSIPANWKPIDVHVKPFGDYDVYIDDMLLRNALSADAVYTGISPSSVNAHVQPRALFSTSSQQTGMLAFIVQHWAVILIASSIYFAAAVLALLKYRCLLGRKSPVFARKLFRFNVDAAKLSESRFAKQGQLHEVGARLFILPLFAIAAVSPFHPIRALPFNLTVNAPVLYPNYLTSDRHRLIMSSDSTSQPIAGIHTFDLPPVWLGGIALWLRVVESRFALHQITREDTKFRYFVAALPIDIATDLRDIIDCPPQKPLILP